jgi:hypothetical protein
LLKANLEVDGEVRYFQKVRNATTLGSFWSTCMDMGSLVVEAEASDRTCLEPTPQVHASSHTP